MGSWWELYPERYERERAALTAAGIRFRRNEPDWARGVLTFDLTYPGPTGPIELSATYPDFYPFFRPEVSAPGLGLPRHQHPVGENLCLIGRRTSNWFVEDTLADLLQSKLDDVLRFGQGGDPDVLASLEEPIGEPAGEYYSGLAIPGSYLLFDGNWKIDPDVSKGEFLASGRMISGAALPTVQAIMLEVTGNGRQLAAWDGPHPRGFDKRFIGRWVRRAPPDPTNPLGSLTEPERQHLFQRGHLDSKPFQRLSAILFPEEVNHRREGDGWCVLQEDFPAARRGRQRFPTVNYVRAARAGPADLAARMPGVEALRERRVLVVGVGAVGAPAAISLARAGIGELSLLDHDVMEAATARRWPIGWSAFGERKVDALKARLLADYPWTTVAAEAWRLGGIESADRQSQRDHLEQLLGVCDLILDTTAEMGVNHFLSEEAQVRRLPYVMANARPGIWGGLVAQFVPGRGRPCWVCLRHAFYGNQPALEPPPADPAGEIQPPGCGEATFTGTAFDAEEISLEAVRVVVGILTGQEGYPTTDWDVGLLRLRANDGHRVPPAWEGIVLPFQAKCQCRSNR